MLKKRSLENPAIALGSKKAQLICGSVSTGFWLK